MAKEKLTTAQNIALKGLTLQEKLDLLHDWKKNGEITQTQFNFFSNHWITKEGKKALGTPDALKRTANENRSSGKMVVEVEMEKFLNNIQSKLNYYLTERKAILLSAKEKAQFCQYAQLRQYRSLSNRILVLGLRYPDKELNQMAVEQVKATKKNPLLPDIHFWSLLWADNLVPMDAVRLMLKKNGNGYEIDGCFSKECIKELIPLMEAQRNKEITRLKWAQSLEGVEREREVARKTRRLNAFNILLEAVHAYIGG